MKPEISRKLCCLQFVCALMIITLHTALPGNFDRGLPQWALTVNQYCCHLVMEPYAVRLYQKLFGTGTAAFVLSGLLLPFLCAALCLIGAGIVRKLCPWLYAVFTGMRPQRS